MSDNDPDGQVTDAGPRPNLPSADAVKRAIGDAPVKQRKAQKKFEKNFKVEESDAERQYAHSRGLQDHYRHKTYWSYFLMVLMFLST